MIRPQGRQRCHRCWNLKQCCVCSARDWRERRAWEQYRKAGGQLPPPYPSEAAIQEEAAALIADAEQILRES